MGDEKLAIYHLAVHREPIEIDTLATQLQFSQGKVQVILAALNWRSLLQTTRQSRYTLQNVVMAADPLWGGEYFKFSDRGGNFPG